jgi:hypothetical protein
MKPDRSRGLPLFLILVILAAVNGVIYILIVPPWQSPDEPTHFEYAQIVAGGDRIFGSAVPDIDLQERIISSMDRYRFWTYLGWPRPQPLPRRFEDVIFLRLADAQTQIGRKPPLYYFLASLPLRLFSGRSIVFKLYLLRSFSLLLTIATVVIVFAAGRMLFPKDRLFPFVPAFITAFLPGFVLIGTSASLDPLANLLSSFFLYLMIRIQFRGYKCHLLAASIAVISLSALVTYKCLSLIPVFLAGMIIYAVLNPDRTVKWLGLAAYSSFILLSLALVYSIVVWIRPEAGAVLIRQSARVYSRVSGFIRGDIRLATYYYPWFHKEVFRSFWVKFGWAMYSLSPVYYLILKVVSIVSLTGVVALIARSTIRPGSLSPPVRRSILLLAFSALIVMIAYYSYSGLGPRVTAQGRHLYVGILSWTILFVLGLRALVPEKLREILYLLLVAFFFFLNAVTIFVYIIPVFGIS